MAHEKYHFGNIHLLMLQQAQPNPDTDIINISQSNPYIGGENNIEVTFIIIALTYMSLPFHHQ